MKDRTNIRDALENHEENKNKDLSSTICEFVSLECIPQVRYKECAPELKTLADYVIPGNEITLKFNKLKIASFS